MSEIDYDSKIESLQEETEQVEVWATEYFLGDDLVRRDVLVKVKEGYLSSGDARL